MAEATIDLSKIDQEVGSMAETELRQFVLDTKVRQRVATKKYYNADAAKVRRQAQAAKYQAACEQLRKLGKFDEVMEAAEEEADNRLAATEVE